MRVHPYFLARGDSNEHWESLRQLRNECRFWFTHHTGVIEPQQQEAYRRTYLENVRHYLYFVASQVFPIGFSRLEWRDNFVYTTYGLGKAYRGRGYGVEVVQHAMLAAGGPMRADQLVDNAGITRIHAALGWRATGVAVEGVLPIEADWDPYRILHYDGRRTSLWQE